MKKILAAAVLACVAPVFAAEPLRLSTNGAYPPFAETNDKGEMYGFDIDIGHALCAEMKRECVFVQTDWDGLIPALKTGKIDVILASMNATDERRKSIAFTDTYYVNPGVYARPKGSDAEVSEAGLKGKVIGVQRASIFDNYITDKYGDIAEILRYNSQEEANLDAVSGRVDVLFADKIVLEDGFLEREIGKDFEIFGDPVEDKKHFGDGSSIGIRKEDTQLKEDLNAALKAIYANGEYKKINDKYFKYDISGGKAK